MTALIFPGFQTGSTHGDQATRPDPVTPDRVHDVLRRSILADGMDLVLDLERSRGAHLVDARDGTDYLDMFTFFASVPNWPWLPSTSRAIPTSTPSRWLVLSTHSRGCWVILPFRICSSSTAARWPSRTR
ncbi:Probable aminotransferase class-III [Mycobacteroides abscessus subsp. abscessus]|nr:Probable aminotransferase class-III [Mycobacteroides abscessus subsp. abscessus]